ncbi:MAG: metallophosphoesterase [Aquabacterium sp.]
MCRHLPAVILILISVLLNGYLAARLLPPLSVWPVVPWLLGALLLLSATSGPAAMWAWRIRHPVWSDRVAGLGYVFMGWFSSMLVLTLLRDIGLGVMALLGHHSPQIETWTALAVALMGTAMTAIGWVNARRTAGIVRIDVPIAGLPEGLHGFTIAQITDIHVGPTIKAPYLQAIVDAVNALEADMVAVTGDLVDGSVRRLAPHVAPLADLKSRHGTYFVMGNHDYYSGGHSWIAELQRLGLRVLLNEHVVLQHADEATLVVAGVTDYTAHHFDPAHRSDPHRAAAQAPQETVKVLLAHQPRSAAEAVKAGFDLQISGHTHGGQFWPWRLAVPLQQPYVAGLHRLQDMWIYISRGTGYWGPPKRFGAPSEITLLRLVKA